MTDCIYGTLSNWYAESIGHNKWEIFDDDDRSVWAIPWRPTPEQLDSINRIYDYGFNVGQQYGTSATQRNIRRALGME